MSFITNIAAFFERLSQRITRWSDDRVWNDLLAAELDAFSDEDRQIVDALLRNQIHHERRDPTNKVTTVDERRAALATSAAICREILPLRNIIGVQPMQGPVGLVFHMHYGEPLDNGRMRLDITKSTVEACSYRLATRWMLSPMNPGFTSAAVSFEAEIIRATAHSVSGEYFNQALTDLEQLGQHANTVIERDPEWTRREFAERLADRIYSASNNIAVRTNRGVGNFVIVPPWVGDVLRSYSDSAAGFAHADDESFESQVNLRHVGTLGGRIKVYTNLTSNQPKQKCNIIVGYMGLSPTDTGYVAAPYVPIIRAGVVVDPVTFEPITALMARGGRYAYTQPEGSRNSPYYSTITVVNGFDPVKVNVDQPSTDVVQ